MSRLDLSDFVYGHLLDQITAQAVAQQSALIALGVDSPMSVGSAVVEATEAFDEALREAPVRPSPVDIFELELREALGLTPEGRAKPRAATGRR